MGFAIWLGRRYLIPTGCTLDYHEFVASGISFGAMAMRSRILQILLLLLVIPFIGWSIFERCEATPMQYREVRLMDELDHPMVEAAVVVALDDRKMTQAEYLGIKKIANKYRDAPRPPGYGRGPEGSASAR